MSANPIDVYRRHIEKVVQAGNATEPWNVTLQGVNFAQ